MGFRTGLSEKRKEKLEKELKMIIPELIKLGVEKIILFGSLSSGEVHKSSDIDLIVIWETEKRFLERLEEVYGRLKTGVAVDILVYTPEEFEEMKEESSLIKSALKNGRVIYEKEREGKEVVSSGGKGS